ncbi:MAG: PH domain-containing protein [Candidatus Methylomirabilia bacterium]
MSDEEQVLWEARPSWWNFFWHWVFFWLIIPVIVALWKRASLLLRVYEDRVVLERGVLSRNIKIVFITDIRTIDIRQSFLQRILRIGTVMIATAGTSGYEDVANGLPDPKGIKELILRQRRKSIRRE